MWLQLKPVQLCGAVGTVIRKIKVYFKKKAVPLQAGSGPEGSRKLMFPDFVTTAPDVGRLSAPAAFTPRKYSWYSFLLEVESTPGT